jgi:hypothetical protein
MAGGAADGKGWARIPGGIEVDGEAVEAYIETDLPSRRGAPTVVEDTIVDAVIVEDGEDVLAAALQYAAAGWHVFPVKGRNGGDDPMAWKEPATPRWSKDSTRDPQQIAAWFTGTTGLGVAVDCGKSGLVVCDGDRPDEMRAWLGDGLEAGWTMRGNPDRVSWLFAQNGTPIGCPAKGVSGGEIKGFGGYVVLPPSPHPIGGENRWISRDGGGPPQIPVAVAALIPDRGSADGAQQATTREVDEALSTWTGDAWPDGLAVVLGKLADALPQGRHDAAWDAAAWAADDARAGLYPLKEALDSIEEAFRGALAKGPKPRRWDGGEWARIVRDAVGRALAKPEAKVEERRRRAVPAVTLLEAPPPLEVGGTLDDEVRKRFPPVDFAHLLGEGRPERTWIVEGLLPAGGAVSIVAPGGAGKSLLCLHLALCIARGRPFLNRATQQRRVLVVDRENTETDLAERLDRLGITEADAPWLQEWITYLDLPALDPLDTEQGGRQIMAILDTYRITAGDVVVLDSAQRIVEGDESASDTWRRYYQCTALELKRRGITSIRLDNTGKDPTAGARGSSSKIDDVDLELQYRRVESRPGDFVLKPTKDRIGGIGQIRGHYRVSDGLGTTIPAGIAVYTSPDYAAEVIGLQTAVDFLDKARVPRSAGFHAAWDAVKGLPDHPSRALVREAQAKRQEGS